jgi:glycosyltransferase involved in cell wall biosynthesis
MREQRCEVIYATGGPFSALMLSAWLARRSGLPLILDLRDPWSIEPNYRAGRSALGQWITDRVEARCFHRADKIILNTASAHAAYVEAYRDRIPAERFTYIRNSFDPELYVSSEVAPDPSGPFTIAYFGNLRPTKNALLFLEAYRAWLDQRSLSPEESQIMMLGELSARDVEQFDTLDLAPYLRSTQPVPFPQAPRVLGEVDLLLDLMGPHHHMQIGGKLYDYLACERPILSVSPNLELDALFAETCAGERVDLEVDAIIGALDRAFEAKRQGVVFSPNREAVLSLSAAHVTDQHADCLDEVSRSTSITES